MEAATAQPEAPASPEAEVPAPEPQPEPPAESELTPRPEEDETVVETSPGEQRTPARMFRSALYVHVGEDAAECEDGENGACGNPVHFHGWCRLPNQFQHPAIREKALAAKARRIRVLRDENSDGYEVLQAEIDSMLHEGEDGRSNLIDQLVSKDFLVDQMEAVKDAKEDDEFKHIDEDIERYRVLASKDEEDRPADEWESLEKHIEGFETAVKDNLEKRQAPRRSALEGRDTSDLVELVRDDRIEHDSNEWFMREYTLWEMYLCTMKPKDPEKPGFPSVKHFGDVQHLQAAAPEVCEALDAAYRDLENTARQGPLGNS